MVASLTTAEEIPERRSRRKSRRASDFDDQLVVLFRNRAELKKEYTALRETCHQLQDGLKAQEGVTEQVREELRALERRLADPAAAYSAIVYYQLRLLWQTCNEELVKFVEEVIGQQQDRERKKQIMEFNQERQKQLAKVSEKITRVKGESDEMKRAIIALEARFDEMTGLFNYFKRRRHAQSVAEFKQRHNQIRNRIEELFDSRIKVESMPWPEYPGLSIEGKRVINIAIIALAQHLYVHFSENNLSALARTTDIKKVHDVNFGTRDDCEYLMRRIEIALEELHGNPQYADQLRLRTKRIHKEAQFRNDADTCPMAASLNMISMDLGGDPTKTLARMPVEVNVLADDFWHLSKVLLR